jgi:hypothetical protein
MKSSRLIFGVQVYSLCAHPALFFPYAASLPSSRNVSGMLSRGFINNVNVEKIGQAICSPLLIGEAFGSYYSSINIFSAEDE